MRFFFVVVLNCKYFALAIYLLIVNHLFCQVHASIRSRRQIPYLGNFHCEWSKRLLNKIKER